MRPRSGCGRPSSSRATAHAPGLRQLGDSGKHIGEPGLRVDVVELVGYAASSNPPGCGADLMPRGLLRMLTIEKPSKIELDSSAIATAAGHPTPQALRNALAPQRWTGNLDASACTTTFAGGRRVGATLRVPSSGGCGSGQRGAAPSNTCRVTDQCQSYAQNYEAVSVGTENISRPPLTARIYAA